MPPWVFVAKSLLLLATGNCGALSFLGWASAPRPPAVLGLPDPLLRMLDGLGALGRPNIMAGPWCASIPLFNNPFLAPVVEGSEPWEMAFWDVRWSNVQTMGQLHAALVAIECSPQQYRDGGVCQKIFGHDARWLATTQQTAQYRLEALQGRLPAAWVAAVAAAAQLPEADLCIETALRANVSWNLGNAAITLDNLTVKLATELHPPSLAGGLSGRRGSRPLRRWLPRDSAHQ